MNRLRPGPVMVAVPFLRKNAPTPVTQSFEDDMVSISTKYGSVWKFGTPARAEFSRSERLHRWAAYRLYRRIRRATFDRPTPEPARFDISKFPQAV